MSDRSVLGRCVLLAATLALLRPPRGAALPGAPAPPRGGCGRGAAPPGAAPGARRARLKSLSDAPRQVRVRLVSPRELEMDPAATTLALAPWGEAAVDAKVVNRAARAGSRYPVFVTAEYDDEGVHHTAVGQAAASIVDGGGLRAHGLLLLAAVLVVVWLALLAWRRFRARPAARV